MKEILNKYLNYVVTPGLDIGEHLPTLKLISADKHVIELGVRGIVSTWAFLAGEPASLLSVDIKHPKEYGGDLSLVEKLAEEAGIPFRFQLEDSLKIDLPSCDILFIDTLHTYDQLLEELKLHSNKAKEYIVMHDTNPKEFPEMQDAISDFLSAHPEWKYHSEWLNNHGLMILKRV